MSKKIVSLLLLAATLLFLIDLQPQSIDHFELWKNEFGVSF